MYLTASILIILILLFLGAYLLFRYALDNQFPGFGSKFPDRKEEYIKYVNSQLKENESFIYHECEIQSFDSLKLKGLYIDNIGHNYAILCHGFSNSPYEMLVRALHFYRMGYSCLLPAARAHSISEGRYRGMGWLERKDMLGWISYLLENDKNAKIILYGLSMGAATVMMTAGEKLPDNVKLIIEDCGYTSVWDQFCVVLKQLFHLPPFPILNIANLFVRWIAKYDLHQASCINQLKKNRLPILFIHGQRDTFVPFSNLDLLYETAGGIKEKHAIPDAGHGESLYKHTELYWDIVDNFIQRYS